MILIDSLNLDTLRILPYQLRKEKGKAVTASGYALVTFEGGDTIKRKIAYVFSDSIRLYKGNSNEQVDLMLVKRLALNLMPYDLLEAVRCAKILFQSNFQMVEIRVNQQVKKTQIVDRGLQEIREYSSNGKTLRRFSFDDFGRCDSLYIFKYQKVYTMNPDGSSSLDPQPDTSIYLFYYDERSKVPFKYKHNRNTNILSYNQNQQLILLEQNGGSYQILLKYDSSGYLSGKFDKDIRIMGYHTEHVSNKIIEEYSFQKVIFQYHINGLLSKRTEFHNDFFIKEIVYRYYWFQLNINHHLNQGPSRINSRR